MVYVIVGTFIVFDFVTGLIKAIKEKAFNSSIMREGLFHKCGSICVILLATLMEFANNYLDLGIGVPLVGSASAYICLMEFGSIVENVGKINPNLIPDKIRELFFKLK